MRFFISFQCLSSLLRDCASALVSSIITLLPCFLGAGLSFAFDLPDTGQSASYAPGDDGYYTINPRSYTDNGDGKVTDNVTGLIWQKQDDGKKYNWYQAVGEVHDLYNPDGPDFKNICGALDSGGQTGWRLPTKKELITLVDYSITEPGPAIDAKFPGTQSNFYWSFTDYDYDPAQAWLADFSSGSVSIKAVKAAFWYVRCVLGTQETQNYSDNGNGTVTDNRNGLVWQKCSAGQNNDSICSANTSPGMVWGAALAYCNDLELDGLTDWRLPNVTEIESLTDDSRNNPAIDPLFPNSYSFYYWSSTTDAKYPDYAWYAHFSHGSVSYYGKIGSNNYVRCVRGGGYGSNKPVRSGDPAAEFDYIQDAYDAASPHQTIMAQAVTLEEYLDFAADKTITIIGGFDWDFMSQPGFTTIEGRVTIGGTDRLTVEKVIIK